MKSVNDRHRRIQENSSYHRKYAKIKTTHVNCKQYNIQSKSLIAIDDIRKEKILRSSFFISFTSHSSSDRFLLVGHWHTVLELLIYFSSIIHTTFLFCLDFSHFRFTFFSWISLIIHFSVYIFLITNSSLVFFMRKLSHLKSICYLYQHRFSFTLYSSVCPHLVFHSPSILLLGFIYH